MHCAAAMIAILWFSAAFAAQEFPIDSVEQPAPN
jgi:hypothetical protein